MFNKTVQTLTKSRPNQVYIIVSVISDLIIRLTFTGDIGTLYPYLTFEKFAFTRQDYGLLLCLREHVLNRISSAQVLRFDKSVLLVEYYVQSQCL